MRFVFSMDIRNPNYNEYITNQLPYYSPYYYNPTEYANSNKYYSGKKKYILGENAWTSLFIPSIDSSYTKECLKSIIENKYTIGRVARIDLVHIKENTYCRPDECSAFIHFRNWYYNPFTVKLREHLDRHKSYNMKYYYDIDVMHIPRDYFVLMKNKSAVSGTNETIKPIPRPHQSPVKKRSASAGDTISETKLNDTLLKQQKRIELLEDELDVLRKLICPEGL